MGKAIAKAADKPRCLTCPNRAQARGLCQACYAAARSAMLTGTKEEELIRKGLLAPRKKPSGRPPNSGFAKALSKKIKS